MRRAILGTVGISLVLLGIGLAALAWWTYPLGQQPAPATPPSAAVASEERGTLWKNDTLGFTLRYPSPWRRSHCFSGVGRNVGGAPSGTDLFLAIDRDQERRLEIANPGGFRDVSALRVSVQPNDLGLSARQWVNDLILRTSPGVRTEDRISNGMPAVRVFDHAFTLEHIVATSDRIISISLSHRDPQADLAAEIAALDLMARSLQVSIPAPTPAPPAAGADALATSLSAAFAARDVTRLASLITSCQFSSAAIQTGVGLTDPAAIVDAWRQRLANGERVDVDANAVTAMSADQRGVRATLFRSGKDLLGLTLILRFEEGVWRWSGVIWDGFP